MARPPPVWRLPFRDPRHMQVQFSGAERMKKEMAATRLRVAAPCFASPRLAYSGVSLAAFVNFRLSTAMASEVTERDRLEGLVVACHPSTTRAVRLALLQRVTINASPTDHPGQRRFDMP
jgi:hypothetical protein